MTGRGSRVVDVVGKHPGGVVFGVCAVLVAGGIGVYERPSDGAARDRVTHAAAVREAAADGATTDGAATTGGAKPAPTFRSVRSYPAVAKPVRLRIPSIKVKTGLQDLGLAGDGTIAAPDEWQAAGWYDEGPRPGQPGPAVIVGHVDSRSGPAVFYRLPELRPGAKVLVDLADGKTVTFKVTGHQQVAKSQFPADLVYSPTLEKVLRLVTCGGTFDAGTGHYRDNIIVTAVAAS
jgi:hypothetical protein